MTAATDMSTGGALQRLESEAQRLASLMAHNLPVTVASVALRDEPSLSLAVRAVNSAHPVADSLPIGARVHLVDAPWYQAAFERGEPIFVERDDEAGFDRQAGLALIPNLQWMYFVPIRFPEGTIGVLGLGEMRERTREPFSPAKRQRCQAILDDFVAMTADAWEVRRLRRQMRVMSSLVQLVRVVSAARSYQEVLVALASEVADWLGTPVRAALIHFTGERVFLRAHSRLPDEVLEDGGRQLVLALTRAGRWGSWPVHVSPVTDDPLDPVGGVDARALEWTRISVPLMRDARLVGVACLYVEDRLQLVDWELEALQSRGDVVAHAVETLRGGPE